MDPSKMSSMADRLFMVSSALSAESDALRSSCNQGVPLPSARTATDHLLGRTQQLPKDVCLEIDDVVDGNGITNMEDQKPGALKRTHWLVEFLELVTVWI
ncbi:hypothetical protein QJS10_CPB18g00846 [Acorus calamus]|uniref:Uncharacterized protein n=1 Tax=Acorus calamus TaxID=4465 RepID=A0AAV9CLT4_ACOCL|nr:hypothetical protein QJS10_CPB18g00846 [Acorus calamus]